ncbi:hypothetical protein [Streptomyces avermitilis]|uniref:hypothetical protein n=1 Tax=Streptomyces avermitilis TaxID=33903 RepID=UPI003405A196
MNASHWKRPVVLSSALILAFTPIGLQQASAAAPSGTHASASTAPSNRNDYRQGYRDGYRDGWNDARDNCHRNKGGRHSFSSNDYERGYGDGFSSGYSKAERRYC